MRRRTSTLAVVGIVVLMAGSAAGGVALRRASGDDGPTPSEVATDRKCPDLPPTPSLPFAEGAAALRLRTIGTAEEPSSVAFLPDGSGSGVLGERPGRVRRVEGARLTDEVVLDLSDDTMQDGDGGLLALAYAPDASWLYVYRADAARDDVLTAYPVDASGRPDPEAGRVILSVDHPDSLQHHAGALVVTADGLLYLGLGDGGGLGDPRENAQDPSTLLGKVLRIDPTPDGPEPYRIPGDNPFVDRLGWKREIWLLGVRNPFRMTLDRETGELWLGDVGQSCWEELDRLPLASAGGANLGWDVVEGNHSFEGGTVPGRQLRPDHEEPHGAGWCAIVAGYVVRTPSLPSLDGRLLYTDYCKGRILGLATEEGADPAVVDTGLSADAPIALVPGPDGDPWVLSLSGTVSAIVSSAG